MWGWEVGEEGTRKGVASGFSESRITDAKVPLVANLKDGNWEKGQRDYSLENIQLLCLNCFYLYVGNLNNRHKKI